MKITACKYQCKGRDPLINSKHFHINEIELIQALSDGGNVLINNKLYPMISGAVYFIDSESLHCTLPQDTQSYCRNKIIVPKDEFIKTLYYLGGGDISEHLVSQGMFIPDSETRQTVENLFYDVAVSSSNCDEFGATLSLLKLCRLLHRKQEKNKLSQSIHIEKVLQYINSHLDKNIKLADICKSLFISESYLCHTFKRELNMTVKEYIREQQIIKAIALLENTDISLEDISQRCGFASHSQFSKCFKEKMKCSPKAYRTKGL